MNSKFVFASFVAALSGLAGLATPAKAGTDLNVHLNLGLPRPPVVVISDHGRRDDYRDDCHDDRSYRNHGYWKEIVVKTWVPGHSFFTRDRRGCEVRVYEPGRYVFRTERVWVAGGRGDRRYDRG